MIIKVSITSIVIILLSISSYSQSTYDIIYEYDAAGNREIRYKFEFSSKSDTTSEFSNKCDTTSKTLMDTVRQNISDMTIKLYPNPVSIDLTISIENYNNEKGSVYVYSVDGKLLDELYIKKDLIKLDFSNKSKGTYIVKILLEGDSKEYTVVKN